MTPHPDDRRLSEAFGALEPSPPQVARLQSEVLAGYEARSRSLVREWLDLLRARPVAHTAWLSAAVVILLFTTPVGAFANLLLRSLSPSAQGHATAPVRQPTAPGAVADRLPQLERCAAAGAPTRARGPAVCRPDARPGT